MSALAGLKALVVEDEGSVAFMIEDMLQELGCAIDASVAHLEDARRIAETIVVDFAVLDVNLNGHPVFPVAEILRRRRIPFIFSTGYGVSGVSEEFRNYPILSKPFTMNDLQQKLAAALEQSERRRARLDELRRQCG